MCGTITPAMIILMFTAMSCVPLFMHYIRKKYFMSKTKFQ